MDVATRACLGHHGFADGYAFLADVTARRMSLRMGVERARVTPPCAECPLLGACLAATYAKSNWMEWGPPGGLRRDAYDRNWLRGHRLRLDETASLHSPT